PLDNPFFILDEKGLIVELFKDFYLNSDMLSNLNSNNKSINVVAQIYAQENGYDSCLLINTNKHVVQAIAGNLFMITANHIKTPPLTDGCIDGIVRKQLIELAMNLTDYQLEETSISPFELQKADELFIANDLTGINSIGNYRKKVYTNEVAKILVGQLNAKARLA
ncbi:MAG: aminotransferase class IV, partial [Croceitalea sp.]|nr:aminotransferase class IV [Croceitalea sp.]